MTCEICGTETNLIKHHLDYITNKTILLCRSHHAEVHFSDKWLDLKPVNSGDYGNVNLGKELYDELVIFYDKQDKLVYPTLKNFVRQKIKELIKKGVDTK